MKDFINFTVKMILIILMHMLWIFLFLTGDFWPILNMVRHYLFGGTLLLCIMIGIQILIYRICPLSSKVFKMIFIIINGFFSIYTYGFTIRLGYDHVLLDVMGWLFSR